MFILETESTDIRTLINYCTVQFVYSTLKISYTQLISVRNRAGFEIFQIFQDWNILVEIFDFETFLNISNISGNI